MKSITAYTATQRYAASQTPAWLLRIVDGGQTWLAASRVITVGGENYPARLTRTPKWRMTGGRAFGAGGLFSTHAEVRVGDLVGTQDSLRGLLDGSQPLGLRADLSLVWIDDAQSWTDADVVTMLSGVIVEWRADATGITLGLRDRVGARRARKAGRILLGSMMGPGGSPALGRWLPIVFGRHEALRLVELQPGVRHRLSAPLGVGDSVIQVTSIDGFPASGTVQVGEELIEYSAIDAVGMTLGSPAQPIVRIEEPTFHSSGEPARSAPPGGFKWLVADHPCAKVEDLRANNFAIAAGDWTVALETIGGIGAQVVQMDRWPFQMRFETDARRRGAASFFEDEVYSPAGGNSALNPELAIDDKRTSTAARLAAGTGLLAFEISDRLGREGKLFGGWRGAALRVRYSATRRWASGSQLILRFQQGAAVFQAPIPRPAASENQGEVQSAPGEERAAVETAVGIHEFELGLDSAIATSTGWGAFDVNPPAQMQVEFIPDTDNAEILIHDLDLIVSYFARRAPEEGQAITARVEGWPDAGGAVIENPADLVELLLTDSRFGALDAADIDGAGLAAVGNVLAAKGYVFARRIEGAAELGELIESAAREAAIWIRPGGAQATFALAGVYPPVDVASELLDEAKALDPAAEVGLESTKGAAAAESLVVIPARTDRGEKVNLWRRAFGPGNSSGVAAERQTLQWLKNSAVQAIVHLGQRRLIHLREAMIGFEQDYPIGAALLEPGDGVTANQTALGLLETPTWIESLHLDTAGRVRIGMRGPEAGEICWRDDAVTLIRVIGFGQRLGIWIEGQLGAVLERGGNLRLAGTLREEALFSAGPFTAPIVHSGGWIYFGAGTGTSFDPFMRIDAAGDLELNGALRQESTQVTAPGAGCYVADATGLRLSPQSAEAAFEFVVSTGRLHLAGILTEQTEI